MTTPSDRPQGTARRGLSALGAHPGSRELAAYYDTWAADYDRDLAGRDYRAPAIAAGLLSREVSPPAPPLAPDIHARTRLLVGDDGLARLAAARVAVIGLGGVGSAAAEQLCRAGVGRLTLVDFDAVRESNLNRQLFALRSTVGLPKAQAAAARLADIDPGCRVDARVAFFDAAQAESLDLPGHHWVLDCIDSLNPKAQLIHHCVEAGVPVITSTGAAAKTDPSGVSVRDLFATRNCPLARHLRRRLRNLGITGGVPAVHSPVPPRKTGGRPPEEDLLQRGRPRIPLGSISYLPALFGCVMAGYVVQDLLVGAEGS